MLAPAVGFRDRLKQSEVLHEHAHVIEAELIFCDECANFLFGLALAHRLPKLEDLLGKVLEHKMPGNQAQALASVQIIREKQTKSIDSRLKMCKGLVEGLQAAKGSANDKVAKEAAELLDAFRAAV